MPDSHSNQLERVEQNIGYRFTNPALLRVALRHSSLGEDPDYKAPAGTISLLDTTL